MLKIKLPYVKPCVTQLSAEEAKTRLLEYARKGDAGAEELLELFISATTPVQTLNTLG